MAIDLIFCAGGATEYSKIAASFGYLLGTRSDYSFDKSLPLDFADVHYQKANFEKHLKKIVEYANRAGAKIKYAIIPDLSDKSFSLTDIDRAVWQVEALKPYVENIIVVPKLREQITFCSQDWLLGYSLPTKNGAAKYSFKCLAGRKVHLLGGSPHNQHTLYKWAIRDGINVISADGSMAKQQAISNVKFWQYSGIKKGQWLRLPQDNKPIEERRLRAWELSCKNIYAAWQDLQARQAA